MPSDINLRIAYGERLSASKAPRLSRLANKAA
jgi:hypothetical protein